MLPSLEARLKEILLRISPLGFIAFGGPSVHTILFKRLFVTPPNPSSNNQPWLDEQTFADLFSLAGALPGPGSTQLLFSIGLLRGGALAGFLTFFLFSLPGALIMFSLALAVSHLPASLPPIVLALLTGLNASAVGLILSAATQLSRATAPSKSTKLILFATAGIGVCTQAVWLFPVLTIGGGLITFILDWSVAKNLETWVRIKLGRRQNAALEELGLPPAVGNAGFTRTVGMSHSLAHDAYPPPSEPAPARITGSATRLPTPPPDAYDEHEPQKESSSHPTGRTQAGSIQSASPSFYALHHPPSATHSLRRRPTSGTSSDAPSEPPPLGLDRTPINFHLSIFQSGLVITLFFTILISILVLRSSLSHPSRALQLFCNFLTAGSILFGGGPVVIPLLQGYTVNPGWVSVQDFLLGFALLSAVPGPNFNFAVFLGTLSLPSSRPLGALLGYLGIFTPGILLKFALLPAYSKFREHPAVKSALKGLNAAASGLVWGAAFRLWKSGLLSPPLSPGTATVSTSLERSGYWAAVSGAAYMASEHFSLPAPLIILGGAVGGLLYGGVKGAPH
ncbi:hypothetical protein T439DRAFT_380067 [Meredithblackwellia eburnea MCA 4105]